MNSQYILSIKMKYFLAFVFVLANLRCSAQISRPQPVSMILDTDIGPDYDDVGAMAVMHVLADRGEVKPLAVIASIKTHWSLQQLRS